MKHRDLLIEPSSMVKKVKILAADEYSTCGKRFESMASFNL